MSKHSKKAKILYVYHNINERAYKNYLISSKDESRNNLPQWLEIDSEFKNFLYYILCSNQNVDL